MRVDTSATAEQRPDPRLEEVFERISSWVLATSLSGEHNLSFDFSPNAGGYIVIVNQDRINMNNELTRKSNPNMHNDFGGIIGSPYYAIVTLHPKSIRCVIRESDFNMDLDGYNAFGDTEKLEVNVEGYCLINRSMRGKLSAPGWREFEYVLYSVDELMNFLETSIKYVRAGVH